MSEELVIRIKKRTLWILLVVFLVVVGVVLFSFSRKVKERKNYLESVKEEREKLIEEAKEYAMRQHIKHVDEGIKYHKNCGMCSGGW